mmetsp:Transcript_22402/g.19308  ORF Transcript_22402/g.19308 Transcript_22402/m.19308 type:complete len:266 (+) Transcript_22402:456-1253(+)
MLVTKVHEGLGVTHLSLHKEVLDLFGIIVCALFDDSFNFRTLIALGSSFDELESHVSVIDVLKNLSQEMEDTIPGTKRFKDLNERLNFKFLISLDSNSDTQFKIFSALSQKILHEFHARLVVKIADMVDSPFKVFTNKLLAVGQDDSSHILIFSVLLKGSHGHVTIFAHISDLLTVINLPNVHLEDGISNLWELINVHFEDLGLPGSIFSFIFLHIFNQETSQLLDLASLQENFGHLVDVSTSLGSLHSSFKGGFRVNVNQILDG